MACNDINSNCIDSCDQIDGLFEAASNLVQYRDIIEKWLHGKQNETVQIGGEQVKTLLGLIADIKQLVGVFPDGRTIILDDKRKVLSVLLASGGGIKVKAKGGLYVDVNDVLVLGGGLAKDKDGKIYVDFSQMPTDKLETLLKQIRVPIWLDGNKDFYVNGTTGSDTLDEGRGESEGKPFKTLQACVNYIADNYNVSRYILTIRLSEGEFSKCALPNYNVTTGRINIVGKSGGATVIKAENGVCLYASGGKWWLYNIYLKVRAKDSGSSSNRYIETGLLYAVSYSNINIVEGVRGLVEIDEGIVNYKGAVRGLFVGTNSNCIVQNLTLDYTKPSSGNGKSVGVYAVNVVNATCNFLTYEYGAVCATINGDFTVSVNSDDGGKILLNNINMPTFAGDCSGKRYNAVRGGTIDTGGRGQEVFPGKLPGTVDTAHFSWYN